jgi:predicted small metal-binding protein
VQRSRFQAREVKERCDMTKVVHCRDIGFDCEGVIEAETEEELMKLVAEHAGTAHDMESIPAEVVLKVKAVMQEV